jgi:DNA-binding FadR family transcriptional regulator
VAAGYLDVIAYVTARIERGEWKPGDRLPTIRELSELTGTGQTAVKMALRILGDRGVTRGRQGTATFVA